MCISMGQKNCCDNLISFITLKKWQKNGRNDFLFGKNGNNLEKYGFRPPNFHTALGLLTLSLNRRLNYTTYCHLPTSSWNFWLHTKKFTSMNTFRYLLIILKIWWPNSVFSLNDYRFSKKAVIPAVFDVIFRCNNANDVNLNNFFPLEIYIWRFPNYSENFIYH